MNTSSLLKIIFRGGRGSLLVLSSSSRSSSTTNIASYSTHPAAVVRRRGLLRHMVKKKTSNGDIISITRNSTPRRSSSKDTNSTNKLVTHKQQQEFARKRHGPQDSILVVEDSKIPRGLSHRHSPPPPFQRHQFYSLLKTERQIHLLCQEYLQTLYPSSSNSTSSSSGFNTKSANDLFLQLFQHKSTSTSISILDLPTPSSLLVLNSNNNSQSIAIASSRTTTTMDMFYATEPLYKDIMIHIQQVGKSWCNTSISYPSIHPTTTTTTTTSIPEDEGWIPMNILRAESWLLAMEDFRSSREELLRTFVVVPTTSCSSSINTTSKEPTLSTGGFLLGKVTSFVRHVFQTTTTTKKDQPTTTDNGKLLLVADEGDPTHDYERQVFAHQQEQFSPNATFYETILSAYSKAYPAVRDSPIYTTKMKALLNHMDSSYASGNVYAKPTLTSLSILLKHYGKLRTTSRAVARKADALLQRMDAEVLVATPPYYYYGQPPPEETTTTQEHNLSNERGVTVETILIVMRAYSKVKQSIPSALRCEALLERIEQMAPPITTEAYNICLRAFLNAVNHPHNHSTEAIAIQQQQQQHPIDDLAFRVERILSRMEGNPNQHASPNTMTYNLAIAIFSASSNTKDNDKALYYIEHLERESGKQREEDEKDSSSGTNNTTTTSSMIGPPSTFAYNSYLLSILARIMTDEQSNSSSRPIRSNSNSNHHNNVADLIDKLYNNMVSHSVSKPDYTTFDTIFGIYRQHKLLDDAGERGEALLSRMEIQYATGCNNLVKPDARMYGHAIKCWANNRPSKERKDSDVVNMASRAYDLLKKMELQARVNTELQPSEAAYATVINVCSCTTHVDHQPIALGIAFECYNKMISLGLSPNAVTYSCLLKCCASLLTHDPKQRKELSKQVFEAACEQGQVNAVVEASLKKASGVLYRLYQKRATSDKEAHSARVSKGLLVTSDTIK